MLSLFRRGGIAQILVAGVVVAIIMVFVLEFRAGKSDFSASFKEECAVKVFDRCVDAKDFGAAFGLIVPRGIEVKDIRQMGLRQIILDGLVERELLLREAEGLELSVSEDELDDMLEKGRAHVSLPVAQAERLSYQLGLCRREQYAGCEPGTPMMIRQLPVRNFETKKFDYAMYERAVRNNANRSPREFKELQQRELIAARLRELVKARVQVSEAEALLLFQRDRSKAVIRSAQLDRSWFAKYAVDDSDAAIDRWAVANAEQVDAAWKTAKESWTPGCPLLREVLVEFAPGASDEDKVLSRDRIEQAKKLVDAGEPFSDVARQISDAESAILGGNVGCVNEKTYGAGADELVSAVKDLRAGQRTGIVETNRGFYLLELIGTLAEGQVEEAGQRFVARRLATRFAADEAAREFATALIDRVKKGDKLEEATRAVAEEFLMRTTHGKRAAKAGKSATAGKGGAERSIAALEVADRPRVEISSPFSMSQNPLSNVSPEKALSAKVFELDKPDAILPEPIETMSGLVVIQLKEKELATREQFDKERETLLKSLAQAKAADALARYIARLRKQAGDEIVIDPRFAEDPKSGSSEDG
jgi:peptidyl-prolyl cis-trans isomerase D